MKHTNTYDWVATVCLISGTKDKKIRDKKVTEVYSILFGNLVKWNYRNVAQLGRALAWGARGRRFESCRSDHCNKRLFSHVRDLSFTMDLNKIA